MGDAEEAADDDETVCSFCGMSHLMYAEQKTKEKVIKKKEDRIVLLEGVHSAPPAPPLL